MKKILLTLVSCFSLSIFAAETSKKLGVIVLLNGTSSAGKSSIIKELQKQSEDTFFVVSLDEFEANYEKNNFDTFLNDFYKHVRDLSLSHDKILVDAVEYEEDYEKYNVILGSGIIKILVYCPLHDILKRVEKRNQLEDVGEHRFVHQAFRQFLSLYKKQSDPGELVIDKIRTIDIKKTLQEIKKEVDTFDLEHPELLAESALKYQKLVHNAQELFDFNNHRKIKITTRQNIWDLIINSSVNSPEQSACEIVKFLEKKL